MKNLKMSGYFKTLVFAGVIFVGVNMFCDDSDDVKDGYYDYDGFKATLNLHKYRGVKDNSITEYSNFLKENNLVPVQKAYDYIDDMSIGKGYYAQTKVDKSNNGVITKGYWKFAKSQDLSTFTGILRISDDYFYKVYDVYYEDDKIIKTEYLVDDIYNGYDCFINLGDPVFFNDYSEVNCYNGKISGFGQIRK